MSAPLICALGICVVSVALEGVFAGSGIKQRLSELRAPRFTPPLWGWIVVGLCYYCHLVRVLLNDLAGVYPQGPLSLLAGGGQVPSAQS